MDVELLLLLIFRWAHIGTAIVLVGGTTFFRFVVMPVLGNENSELIEKIRKGWKKFVHTGVAIFIVSGFYNYMKAIPLHKGDGLYHMLVATKILLAFFVFFIASALVGHTAGTQKFRDGAKKWTGIMLLAAVTIIGISGFVKIRGIPVMPVDPATEVSVGHESIGVLTTAFDDEFAQQ